jgi:hypothetical protein
MNKRTKALQFDKETTQAIFERDSFSCIVCGSNQIDVKPHHIKFKSRGGMGVLQNGVTLCRHCHDKSHGKVKDVSQKYMYELFTLYIARIYGEWNETLVVYNKYREKAK